MNIKYIPYKKIKHASIGCTVFLELLYVFLVCDANEFQCTMGRCVPIDTLCDGFIDCPDFSDETQGCGK